jgi:thiol-disulfide isomerase/thioredoxin
MKRLTILMICLFVFLSSSLNVYAIEPNYILQIFNSGDYPVLISDTHNILFENFTATWCGWCHFSYEIFDTLRERFGKQVINIRYHNQDELVMNNITDRSSYYKVNGYPTMIFNGNNKMLGADATTYPSVEKLVISLL